MLLLCLDTSTPAVAVALTRHRSGADPEVLAERAVVDARRHGELLAPLVAQVLADAGVRPPALSGVAVGLGPGPFTGLRVGIATAAALGDAVGVPVYGACSLDVLARGGLPEHPDVVVATDARRREVYAAAYRAGERVGGPWVLAPAALAARIEAEGLPRTVLGEGALRYPEAFAPCAAAEPRFPRASDLADLVDRRLQAQAPGDALTPIYLRRPDAAPPAARKAVVPA